ncbi:kinase [Micromonospora carbonacea]|uniref:Guanylate kinase n=1 Tax=Micromonospora carbonacea TaxID=47853 RepID=A0A1C4Z9K0_9ACTN|nr:kinase [Micromonospora carbonacea]SCF29608.1 guanylate kinase [Micromonospora carbonacea]
MKGVILYGPPAAGKDSITSALRQLDSRYTLYPRLKAGPGRTTGYRMADEATVDALRANGDVVWENRRYDAVYVVDRPSLAQRLDTGIPVVHLGQRPAVNAVTEAIPGSRWFVVYVWCPRDVAEERIIARGTGDTDARLAAWDATEPLPGSDLMLNTAQVLPLDAARQIDRHVLAEGRPAARWAQ